MAPFDVLACKTCVRAGYRRIRRDPRKLLVQESTEWSSIFANAPENGCNLVATAPTCLCNCEGAAFTCNAFFVHAHAQSVYAHRLLLGLLLLVLLRLQLLLLLLLLLYYC